MCGYLDSSLKIIARSAGNGHAGSHAGNTAGNAIFHMGGSGSGGGAGAAAGEGGGWDGGRDGVWESGWSITKGLGQGQMSVLTSEWGLAASVNIGTLHLYYIIYI